MSANEDFGIQYYVQEGESSIVVSEKIFFSLHKAVFLDVDDDNVKLLRDAHTVRWIRFDNLYGVNIQLPVARITGFTIATPEAREAKAQWEALSEAASKECEPKDWEAP